MNELMTLNTAELSNKKEDTSVVAESEIVTLWKRLKSYGRKIFKV